MEDCLQWTQAVQHQALMLRILIATVVYGSIMAAESHTFDLVSPVVTGFFSSVPWDSSPHLRHSVTERQLS